MIISYRLFPSIHRHQITAALGVYFEFVAFAWFCIGAKLSNHCAAITTSLTFPILHILLKVYSFNNSFGKIHYFGFGSTLNNFECHVCRCRCAIEYRIQSHQTKTQRSQFYTLCRFLWYRIDCDRDNDIISILIAKSEKNHSVSFRERNTHSERTIFTHFDPHHFHGTRNDCCLSTFITSNIYDSRTQLSVFGSQISSGFVVDGSLFQGTTGENVHCLHK